MNKKRYSPPSRPVMLERVLTGACMAITAIDSGSVTLDDLLDHAPEDCRRMLEHLLMQFYRYRKFIRKSWQKFCRKMPSAEISALLDAAVTQLFFQDQVSDFSVVNVAVMLAKSEHADKFVNAVLRSILRDERVLPEKAQGILPDAVLKRWQKNFPAEKIEEFAGLFLLKPEFTFRLCKGAELPEKCREAAVCPIPFCDGDPCKNFIFKRVHFRQLLYPGSGGIHGNFTGCGSFAGVPFSARSLCSPRRENTDGSGIARSGSGDHSSGYF